MPILSDVIISISISFEWIFWIDMIASRTQFRKSNKHFLFPDLLFFISSHTFDSSSFFIYFSDYCLKCCLKNVFFWANHSNFKYARIILWIGVLPIPVSIIYHLVQMFSYLDRVIRCITRPSDLSFFIKTCNASKTFESVKLSRLRRTFELNVQPRKTIWSRSIYYSHWNTLRYDCVIGKFAFINWFMISVKIQNKEILFGIAVT